MASHTHWGFHREIVFWYLEELKVLGPHKSEMM